MHVCMLYKFSLVVRDGSTDIGSNHRNIAFMVHVILDAMFFNCFLTVKWRDHCICFLLENKFAYERVRAIYLRCFLVHKPLKNYNIDLSFCIR